MKWADVAKWSTVALLSILFLLFVWPTPYEYTRQAPNIWRVSRLTGVRERSTDDGWKTETQIRAEEDSRRAQIDKESKEAELALAVKRNVEAANLRKPKYLYREGLGNEKNKTSLSVTTSYYGGSAHCKILLAPVTDALRIAKESGSRLYSITIALVDENGFSLGVQEVPLPDLVKVVGKTGEAISITGEVAIPMEENEYRRVDNVDPTWRW